MPKLLKNLILPLLVLGIVLQPGMLMALYVGCFVFGLLMGSYLLIPYSLVPDLVEYYQAKTGERHESVFFGLWMTVHQLGIAAAGPIIGGILSITLYDPDVALAGAAAVGVRLIFGVIPGAFLLMAALAMQFYGISRETYAEARSRLKEPRS